jgi:hypothetical protein
MEAIDIQPGVFRVEPLEGESLSHFWGRFRRANNLTPNRLGKMAGLSGAIARWEKFRFNPPPSLQQLDALAVVVGVERERLQEMLPPPRVGMKLEPPRLCGCTGYILVLSIVGWSNINCNHRSIGIENKRGHLNR